MSDFTHEEVMDALDRRHDYVMRELRRTFVAAMAVIVPAGLAMVATAALGSYAATMTVLAVGLVVQCCACVPLFVRSPERLRRRWNEKYAAIGAHLVARGMP